MDDDTDVLAGMEPVRTDMDKGGWFRGNDPAFPFGRGSEPTGFTAQRRDVSGRFYTAPVENGDEAESRAYDGLKEALDGNAGYAGGFISIAGDLAIDVTNHADGFTSTALLDDVMDLQRELAKRGVSMYGTMYFGPVERRSEDGRYEYRDLMDRYRWEVDTDGMNRLIGISGDNADKYADGPDFDEI